MTTAATDDSVCSVDGYVDVSFGAMSGPWFQSTTRRLTQPADRAPACMDPSRLVCPTVATALAGTTTSGLHRHLDVGMPAAQRHFADAADHDVVDHHRRIGLQRADIRDLDVIQLASLPRPTAPGSGSEFTP